MKRRTLNEALEDHGRREGLGGEEGSNGDGRGVNGGRRGVVLALLVGLREGSGISDGVRRMGYSECARWQRQRQQGWRERRRS